MKALGLSDCPVAREGVPADSRAGQVPLVTVVVPVYNAAAWVAETIRSVLAQTCDPHCLELVLVDDGSTDAGMAVAEEVLRRGRVPYRFVCLSNGGPSLARNAGWRLAQGEWVQFLDADDLLHPAKIAHQIATARQVPPDVAVLYSDWQHIMLSCGEWVPAERSLCLRLGTDVVHDLLTSEHYLQLGALLVRKNWLEKVSGFDERYWLIEDVDLELRLAMAGGQFRRSDTPFPVAFHRLHKAGSLSSRNQQEWVQGCVRNARMVELYWKAQNQFSAAQVETLTDIYYMAARFHAPQDARVFDELAGWIDVLVPGFLPSRPWALRWLSRLLGYRLATRLAAQYRRFKRWMIRWQPQGCS
jgi:glycosyltransferase involved in cell wall biosynthesis